MDRITKGMVERQLQNFCDRIGEKTGHGNGEWNLYHNAWGYRVERVSDDNLGVSTPLGMESHPLREMFYMLYAMNNFGYWKDAKECQAQYTLSHPQTS